MKSGATADDVTAASFIGLGASAHAQNRCRLSVSRTCLLTTTFFVLLGSYTLLTLVSRRPDDLVPAHAQEEEEEAVAWSGNASTTTTTAHQPHRLRFPKTKRLRRRLPRAVIVGVRKCGTRAILEFLNMHPQVVKAIQEVHFFDDDSKYSLGLEWYRRKMPYSFPDQITVEKSPSYFITRNAPHRIYAMNPDVRLLVIVREPVTRTISDYTQIMANKAAKGKAYESFEQLVLNADTGDINEEYKAVQISLYDQYMSRWLDVFPRHHIHVVDGERLVREPMAEVRLVEHFLGLKHFIHSDNFYFNKTKGFYCLRNETTEKCLSETKGRKHPQVSPRVVDKLKKYFETHNERFFQMIGQRFNWTLPNA